MLWLAGGTGVVGSWAAESRAVSQSAKQVGAGEPAAVGAPLIFPASPRSTRPRTVGKPDPFRPFIETDPDPKIRKSERVVKKGGEKSRPISPLQQREVGQFRLVGIAGDDRRRTAVVEDGTAKKIYPLLVGTHIGPNEGRVVEILPDRVIVEERVEDQTARNKKIQVRRVTMRLHKEE